MAKVNEDVLLFVREALAQGMTRTRIEAVLLEAGWGQEQVSDALQTFAEIDFPVPVPRPQPSLSAREAFLYLLLFTTLYISAYHLGSILFIFVERAFPDPAFEGAVQASMDSLRFSVASLVVAFPVYLWVARLIHQAVRKRPVMRASQVRKWLTYLTLFLAAAVIVGDLTTLVYHLLGGELTVRFVLKVVIVGGIAGGIFGYYLRDLKRDED